MFVASPQSLRRSSNAKWLLPLAILITGIMTMGHSRAQSNTPETKLSISKDGTATVTGIVQENVKRCTVDLSCYLRLKFQDQELKVLYVTSEGEPCVNDQASEHGLAVKKDQRIEAHGKYHKEGKLHIISTCPSKSFYIKILDPSQ
jgi:hypothetical protein